MALLASVLGLLTMLVCAVLLLRQYAATRQRLLLWSGLCFATLALSNALLCIDLASAAPALYVPRLATAAAGMVLLVYGLIWESDTR